MLGSTADDFHPPVKSVFTFGAEEVDVIFELQFENKVFVNVIPFVG